MAESDFFSAIVDLTWGGWAAMKMEAEMNGMPYIRLESTNNQFVKVCIGFILVRLMLSPSGHLMCIKCIIDI